MTADKSDPIGAARPIGYSVSGYILDAKKAPGILTVTIDIALCKNDHIDKLHALK